MSPELSEMLSRPDIARSFSREVYVVRNQLLSQAALYHAPEFSKWSDHVVPKKAEVALFGFNGDVCSYNR